MCINVEENHEALVYTKKLFLCSNIITGSPLSNIVKLEKRKKRNLTFPQRCVAGWQVWRLQSCRPPKQHG